MSSGSGATSAFAGLHLQRYPNRKRDTLQPFNSADALLVEELSARQLPAGSTLVVNDEHGALAVAIQAKALWTDSALAVAGLQANLTLNQRPEIPVIWSTASPGAEYAAVAIKIPKLLDYFEYQLACLADNMPAGTVVLAAGMDKHLSPRVGELLERYIGPTERHRGQRKARLFSATRDDRPATAPNFESTYHCPPLEAPLINLANVFSRDKLDIGSRFLLQHLAKLPPAQQVLDLACGNGVLGLCCLTQGIAQRVALCDESAMAIESARRSAQGNGFGPEQVSFHLGDGLLGYQGPHADLIVCNPPFHLNHAVDDYAGRRLIEHSADHLTADGKLCVVANRHLNYLPTFKRGFRRVEQLAQNNKFILYLAYKN